MKSPYLHLTTLVCASLITLPATVRPATPQGAAREALAVAGRDAAEIQHVRVPRAKTGTRFQYTSTGVRAELTIDEREKQEGTEETEEESSKSR